MERRRILDGRPEERSRFWPLVVAAGNFADGVVVFVGLLFASLALARMDAVNYRPLMDVWEWSHAFPVFLFAILLVFGSLAGMRKRQLAALSCLVAMLVCVGSCWHGALSNAGRMPEFLPVKYSADENPVGPFQLGSLALMIGFAIIGSIIAFREHLRPRYLYLSSVFVFVGTLVFDFFRCSGFMAQELATPGALLAIVGSFWLVSDWLDWPVLIRQGVSARRQVAIFSLFPVLVAILATAGSLYIASLHGGWTLWRCKQASPLSKPQYPEQTVFIAKSRRFAGINVLLVQKYYWGLPWWDHKLAFFAPAVLHNGQTYLVDGGRTQSPFTWFIPTVQLKSCSRMSTVEDADVDLRVLRDGVPRSGVRIIERVRKDQPDRAPVPSVKVVVDGPRGVVVTTTDERGIYDVEAKEPGHYTARIESCRQSGDTDYRPCAAHANLKVGDVWGETLWIPQ